MPLQVATQRKSGATVFIIAPVGLLTGMAALVCDQVCPIRKSRPAAVADMRLNVTVNPLLVGGQVGLSRKARAAAVTDIRPLPCMCTLVCDQDAALREALPTAREVADIRFLE